MIGLVKPPPTGAAGGDDRSPAPERGFVADAAAGVGADIEAAPSCRSDTGRASMAVVQSLRRRSDSSSPPE